MNEVLDAVGVFISVALSLLAVLHSFWKTQKETDKQSACNRCQGCLRSAFDPKREKLRVVY